MTRHDNAAVGGMPVPVLVLRAVAGGDAAAGGDAVAGSPAAAGIAYRCMTPPPPPPPHLPTHPPTHTNTGDASPLVAGLSSRCRRWQRAALTAARRQEGGGA